MDMVEGCIFSEADKWLLENWSAIDDVLAIVFLGRSGSVFLSSLLDSHPQVVMLPGTQLAFYYSFWDNFGYLDQRESLIGAFCAYFSTFFDVHALSPLSLGSQPAIDLGFAEMGEDRNETLEIDKQKFMQIMRVIFNKTSHLDRRSFFQAVHIAYTIALNRSSDLDQSRLPLIVYQLHMNWPTTVTNLFSDFPKTKMIHMIREPFQTIGSHFKHGGYNCNVLNKFYDDAFPYANIDHSRAVKLEELHTQPKVILEKITQWTGISWSDSLLKSTFHGKKWWNLKAVEQVSGFNQVIISKNHDGFYYKFDQYRLNVLYQKRFKLWEYPFKRVSKFEQYFILLLLFVPFKMEIINWHNNITASGWRGMVRSVLDCLHITKRRNQLITAWRYSLSGDVKEVPLL